MENITVVGMKDINLKLMKIEKHLNDISTSLEKLTKIMDRHYPKPVKLVTGWDPVNGMDIHLEEEDEDDLK